MRFITTFLVVAIGAGAAVMTVQPASAGSGMCTWSSTNGNRACVYVDRSFVGLMAYKWEQSGLSNLDSEKREKMSSWENRSIWNGAWYPGLNGTGSCKNMHQRTEVGWVGHANNDDMISWRMNRAC